MMGLQIMTWPLARLRPLTIALVLAACEPSTSDMGNLTSPMPKSAPVVTVREQQRHLSVSLTDGDIGDADWARIDTFLADAADGRPRTVHLVVAAEAPAADFVVRHALALGYVGGSILVTPAAGKSSRRMTVELTARTYVAVLPNCPQTGHLNLIDSENTVSSDWGCATMSMFGLQVADPHDLVRGQDGGVTDSVITTAAIRRLQTDKVKPLENASSKSTGASQ